MPETDPSFSPDVLHTSSGVCRWLNLSRPSLYRLQKIDPDFPAPVIIGSWPRWTTSAIADYITKKTAKKPAA